MARHLMTRVTLMTARAGLCAAVLFGSSASALAACPGPAGFGKWLQGFKQQAIAEGISPQTVNAALNGVTYYPTAIAHDRRQCVFAQDYLTFQGRMVSNNRMNVGKSLLRKYGSTFKRIEQQYGVPGPVLVAYWGLETDFGKVMGNLPSIRSLATLAYDCRRPEEFREQLMYALKVIDRGDLSPGAMKGPAHGEVGQFQFQPKTYYDYAVDFDGVIVIRLRLELELANLTVGRPLHRPRREIAAVDDFERIHQLLAELLRPAAVIGQSGERADARQIAHDLAEVGLQPPIGDQHRTRHAVLLLDALEGRSVFAEQRLADIHPVVGHHAALEGQIVLGENTLATVMGDGRRIIGDAVQCGVDRLWGDAFGDGLLLKPLKPLIEAGGARAVLRKDARSGTEQHRRAKASACC